MHVYYVEHSFARPNPSATNPAKLRHNISFFSIMAFGDLSLPDFQYPPSLPFRNFFQFQYSSNFQNDTMAITFTITNLVCIQKRSWVKSRGTAKIQEANYVWYDQVFLSKFTFKMRQNFQEWASFDGVDVSMNMFLHLIFSEVQIEIRLLAVVVDCTMLKWKGDSDEGAFSEDAVYQGFPKENQFLALFFACTCTFCEFYFPLAMSLH